jgi:hypothetical protein
MLDFGYRAVPRALPRHLWREGHLANLLVTPETPAIWQKIEAIIASGKVPACSEGASMRECVRRVHGGVLIPLNWLR